MALYRAHVLVCKGTGCTASGSGSVYDALKGELERRGLDKEVMLVETGVSRDVRNGTHRRCLP